MAQVQTVDAPQVQESGAPLGINPPAEAFGAQVAGAGLQQMGQATGQAADMLERHAEAYQQLNNKSEADRGFSTVVQAANEGFAAFQQNYKEVLNTGGVTAAEGVTANFYKTLGDTRDNIGKSMSNPMAQSMYDADSRRVLMYITGEGARFASTERTTYLKGQQIGIMKDLLNTSVNAADPDAMFQTLIPKFVEAQGTYDHLSGTSREAGAQNVKLVLGKAVADIAEGISNKGDAGAALAFLDKYKDHIDAESYTSAYKMLSPAYTDQLAANIAHESLASVLGHASAQTVDPATAISGFRGGQAVSTQASAEAYLKSFGIDAQWTSGYRDAAANAAAKGAPDSEHTTDNAWDFVPKHGQTIPQLAQQIRDSGIPFNQLEVQTTVDAQGHQPHVHVSVEPSGNKGEIIGNGADALPAPRGIGNSLDLESHMSQVEDDARARADATRPNDTAFADKTAARASRMLQLQVGALRDQEAQTAGKFATWVASGAVGLGDLNAIYSAFPGAPAAFASLPGGLQETILNAGHAKANEMTPSRQDTVYQLIGEEQAAKTGSPEAFLQEKIANMDLPLALKAQWMQKQSNWKVTVAKVNESDNFFDKSIKKGPDFAAAVGPSGLNLKDDKAYNQFLGTVRSQYDEWLVTHKDAVPQGKDIAGFVSAASQKTAGGLGSPAFAYQPTQEEESQAKAYLLQHKGNNNPNAFEISQIVGLIRAADARKAKQ